MKKILCLLALVALTATGAQATILKGRIIKEMACNAYGNCTGWQASKDVAYITIDDKNSSYGGYFKIVMNGNTITSKILGGSQPFYDEDGWPSVEMQIMYNGQQQTIRVSTKPDGSNQFVVTMDDFNGGQVFFWVKP